MPTLTKISDGEVSTSELFSEANGLLFEIHPPQRRFKWGRTEIKQLWDDILTAYNDNRSSYFLGSLLLTRSKGSNQLSVIDGQQRITTLSILLAVLRDQCREFSGLRGRARNIQRLIVRVDRDDNPAGPLTITLQDPDNQAYIRLVKEPDSTESPPGKSDLLSSAAKKLTELLKSHIGDEDTDSCIRRERLHGLCEFVQTKVKFLPLEVRDESEGYLVFDTTNTRGLRPTPAEALKARLATVARVDPQLSGELISTWNEAAMKLENAGLRIEAMDDYLHAIWCTREGYTKKRTLDKTVESKLREPGHLKDFIKDLGSYCQSYLAVVAPKEKTSLTEDLDDLNRLNVAQSHSFLMTVHKIAPHLLQEAVDLVLSLQIRNVTIGSHRPNEYEKDWPNWAKLIRGGFANKAFNEIRSRMDSDDDFRRAFETKVVKASKTARTLLRRLDPISSPGSGVQPVEVDVEHILPKSVVGKLVDGKHPKRNDVRWIEDLGFEVPETRKAKRDLRQRLEPSLYMLGNQALLNDKANRGARNLPFAKKKEFYRKQALELTKEIADLEMWGLSQIQERQRTLAERAVDAWPRQSV